MLRVCEFKDTVAFGELVWRWQSRIQVLCLRMTGNWQDAEDAMQETFARAFSGRAQFRGESRFSTWLWRIAIRSSSDICRKRRPADGLETVTSVSNDPDPSIVADTVERRDAVATALEGLSEDLRIVVTLKHFQQLKFREIADVLGIPVGTVCSRMAEAINQLEESLKSYQIKERES